MFYGALSRQGLICLFKSKTCVYTGPMNEEGEKQKAYRMPALSDEFLYQLIFCMEDQANRYCLDVQEGVIYEVSFVQQRRAENPERFLDLPEWRPADGFRTMEKFVSSLRNPLYRERLHKVLQSGKGVFRQFKDVLHEQPPLERLWFYYKDREIRQRIYAWYERHDEAFRLSSLGEEGIEDDSEDLVRQDFTITDDASPWEDEIQRLGEKTIGCMNIDPVDTQMAKWIKKRWLKSGDEQHLVALSATGQFAGFIRYKLLDKKVAMMCCYALKEEYQGLGVFRFLITTLCSILAKENIQELVVPLAGKALNIEPMFEEVSPRYLAKVVSISVARWCDEEPLPSESSFV